ncbi:ABC transporter ATP-binding protein [Methanogenium sp. MK-MG]|uniref:ABC transporter ATP-binding protein n=1 Tax=Methanogenium sp. MK-MG TaxID=2599926 RepID=UPI0013EB220E|nr:ABC transporter ATP-binding protein [Methanogenium sp. MK-MG]KAF1075563.1 Vitamin B12 import ATP-binding protein BtuD [Methanogenium sp. MK-MG]
MTKNDNKGISWLLDIAGNYCILIILACILSGISAILSLIPYICIWFVVRDIFHAWPDLSTATGVTWYGWLAVGFAVLSILFYFGALICSHLAAFRVEKNIRKEAMHKIVTLPLGFFDQNTSGRMRKIIDDNAAVTHTFMAHLLPDLAGAVVMPVATLILLFVFDWRLGLVSLIPLALSVYYLKQMIGGDQAGSIQKYMDALEEMNTEAVEYVRGIPVVKVFQQTVYSFKDFHQSIQKYRDWALDYALRCRLPMTNYKVVLNGTFFLLIPVGLLLIAHAPDYKGFLLNLIFYILFTPVCAVMMSKIMRLGEGYFVATEAVSRVTELLNEEPLPQPAHPEEPEDRSIAIKNVSFTYPGSGEKALNTVSLVIPEGKTCALVGPSDGGKTTIASLIPRFWDVQEGAVEVGGVDVRHITSDHLMEQIAFVFQNAHLFKASILENIRFARPGANREEVMKAVELARCTDIIEKFSQGLDTIIGTDGVYLSGGEQQRIALARAILKDAPIIILDEATAFADPENEYQIQRAFEKLTANKTVLMIAHRLSSVRNADCIMVIRDGEVKEQGTHTRLLAENGLYAEMWQEYQRSVQWKVGNEEGHHA